MGRGAGYLMVMSLILMAAFYLYDKSQNPDPVKIVASIETRTDDITTQKRITFPQLQTFAKNAFGSYEADKGKDMVNLMIDQELLIINAEKTGIVKNILQPRFDKQLKYAKENLMLDLFFEIAADENIVISDAEIQEYYDKQPIFLMQTLQFENTYPDVISKSAAATRDLNNLQNFAEVFKLYYPDKIYSKTRSSNIINYYKLPVYLEEFSTQLSATGKATKPIETEQGYTIYYRDAKPTLIEAADFIYKDIKVTKTEEYKQALINEINKNSKVSLFNLDRIYKQKRIATTDEVLVSNRLTDDTLTERELSEKLADLYQIYELYNVKYNDLIDYIMLFIQQKVLLSLAENKNEEEVKKSVLDRQYKPKPSNYYDNPKFLRQWQTVSQGFINRHNEEIVNYMLEKFYEDNKKNMTDKEVTEYYSRDPELYRNSDFFKLQRIVLNSKGAANQVYNECIKRDAQNRLVNDFEALVMKYSNEPFKNMSRGIGPFLGKTQLEPSYDMLVTRNIGDIVPPVEATEGVYHIYKILEVVRGSVKPLSEVKTQVQTKLTFDNMRDYIEEIKRRHNIKVTIYEENLVPVPKAYKNIPILKWFPDSYLRKLARGEV